MTDLFCPLEGLMPTAFDLVIALVVFVSKVSKKTPSFQALLAELTGDIQHPDVRLRPALCAESSSELSPELAPAGCSGTE